MAFMFMLHTFQLYYQHAHVKNVRLIFNCFITKHKFIAQR